MAFFIFNSWLKKIAGGNWREIKGGEVLEKENGLDLITAIDIDLQDYVDNILKKQLKKLKAEYGSVVVMEMRGSLADLALRQNTNK